MKETTLRQVQQLDHFLGRVIIDRKLKKANAVLEEQRRITKECGGNVLPAYLYNYYVSICQIPTWDLTDDAKIAKQLGITQRKVADTRRLLTKMNWIKFDTHRHGGVAYGMWFIGKEVVEARIGVDTRLEEFVELGVITSEEYDVAKGCENKEGIDND
jgi:hypothetical protein